MLDEINATLRPPPGKKMKTCSKCGESKEASEFSIRDKDKFGNIIWRSDCKKCVCERSKYYYRKNPEKMIKNSKEWGKKNPERRKKSKRDWEHKNKEKLAAKRKTTEYRAKSKIKRNKIKDILNAKRRQWVLDNPEKQKKYNERAKAKRKLNPEKYRKQDNDNYHKNKHKETEKIRSKMYKEKRKPKRNAFEKIKKKKDPFYKMKLNLRSRTSTVFKRDGYKKQSKTEQMLGSDFQTVKKHIESQFKHGMVWENYGKKKDVVCWEIDHIIPLSSAKTMEELILLCHYTNLQPLWAEENNKKNNKILPFQMKITV